jgi:hypothetical protein
LIKLFVDACAADGVKYMISEVTIYGVVSIVTNTTLIFSESKGFRTVNVLVTVVGIVTLYYYVVFEYKIPFDAVI